VLSFDAGFTAPLLGLTVATLKLFLSFVSIHGCGISKVWEPGVVRLPTPDP
jgi:hypothetical protein